jgi:hypothetical protein
MSIKTNIALALAVALCTTSGALAATKHKVHHPAARTAGAAAFGAVKTVPEESYMYLQRNRDGWPSGRPNNWTGGN